MSEDEPTIERIGLVDVGDGCRDECVATLEWFDEKPAARIRFEGYAGYIELSASKRWYRAVALSPDGEPRLMETLRRKPTRTLSGTIVKIAKMWPQETQPPIQNQRQTVHQPAD
jgi:hypothetical protein